MASRNIPYARQSISEQDIQAVIEVLKGDWLTQGPHIDQFEKEISQYCDCPHVLAIANATAALHVACLALGVGPGDFVWTSANSFVASSNCALYCGAEIDFVDIHPKTYNMCTEALEEKLVLAKEQNRLPKVVIPVHFSGQSCDMKKIHRLSKQYGFKLIEDASHALGGDYDGKKVGHAQYSDIVVFSLHPAKMITTGEGGLMLTRNVDLHRKMKLLRTHGITKDPQTWVTDRESDRGAWYMEQQVLGFNYRITDFQAALGSSQLKRLDAFVEKRRSLVENYNRLLAEFPLQLPVENKDLKNSYHIYVVRLSEAVKKTRKEVFESLRSQGVLVNVHYMPIYLQPYYQKLGFKRGHCEEAEKYYESAITLPLYYDLKEEEQAYVTQALKKALGV
ncbi:MAG: UDP-4-amino-4,6-dideoxy-N-acetyl-beta-L-altrosamine transaminase [Pseudobdellovibrionaceae bacterium]